MGLEILYSKFGSQKLKLRKNELKFKLLSEDLSESFGLDITYCLKHLRMLLSVTFLFLLQNYIIAQQICFMSFSILFFIWIITKKPFSNCISNAREIIMEFFILFCHFSFFFYTHYQNHKIFGGFFSFSSFILTLSCILIEYIFRFIELVLQIIQLICDSCNENKENKENQEKKKLKLKLKIRSNDQIKKRNSSNIVGNHGKKALSRKNGKVNARINNFISPENTTNNNIFAASNNIIPLPQRFENPYQNLYKYGQQINIISDITNNDTEIHKLKPKNLDLSRKDDNNNKNIGLCVPNSPKIPYIEEEKKLKNDNFVNTLNPILHRQSGFPNMRFPYNATTLDIKKTTNNEGSHTLQRSQIPLQRVEQKFEDKSPMPFILMLEKEKQEKGNTPYYDYFNMGTSFLKKIGKH